MRPLLILLSLSVTVTFITSCKGEKNEGRDARFAKDDFFSDSEVSGSLTDLSNEMADGETDFLRSFAGDQLAWQKWDKSILRKAQSTQTPIFAFVGSSLGGVSRRVAEEISRTEDLRNLVKEQSVCTVVDTHISPEIGSLAYYLCSEIPRATAFPLVLWLSHEGNPIAWIPIGDLSGRELSIVMQNASAMVDDIWGRSSDYAVNNSRRDNEARQRRFEFKVNSDEPLEDRLEIFRRSTRRLSSLYSFGDKDLDYIGGLVPTSSLELLALGSRSARLTDEVRERCRNAAREVCRQLVSGAVKDHLDGSYFYARRTTDWSLPSFSKNLSSQAKVARTLLRLGTILDDQKLVEEGISLVSLVEKDWLEKSVSSESPKGDADEVGKFFWDYQTLQSLLNEDEFKLAEAAFSLKESGNVPSAVDPLENYHKLNTLRRIIPLSELASNSGTPVEQVEASLQTIIAKLAKFRDEKLTKLLETTLTVTELALVLEAQVGKAVAEGDLSKLNAAVNTANLILGNYRDAGKGLTRVPKDKHFVQARCGDYASVSHAFFTLYQATLDEQWLTIFHELVSEAVENLKHDNGLLVECREESRVIPLRQHDRTMIFGESSLGLMDHSFNRALALTGDNSFRELLATQAKSISSFLGNSTVNHTDFIASCALGSDPLLAVLQGEPGSPEGQKMLLLLNSQKYLPFLTIRPLKGGKILGALPELASSEGGVSVVMVRNGETLGQASSAENLEALLEKIISER